jgi:TetR/AcrR family transcriptional regulator, mexJK operon transcriptional repressor
VPRIISKRKVAERHSVGRPNAGEVESRITNLLDLAADVFMERGYEGASVREIASRANASKETIYSRFPSKAALFSAVMNRRCEQSFSRLADILHAERPIGQILTSFALELITPSLDLQWKRLLRTIIGAAETFPEVGQTFWRIGPERAHLMIADCLSDRMKKGELRKGDASKAAHLFLAMCTGRYWLHDVLGIRPQITKAEAEIYIKEVVPLFLSIYAPAR